MTVISRPAQPTSHPRARSGAPSLSPSPLRTALRLAADPSRWRLHVDFDPKGRYHRRLVADEITNQGPDPAVSLHVDAPRLEVQHDYVSDDGILRRTATRREGEDG